MAAQKPNVCFNLGIEGDVTDDVVLCIEGMGFISMDKKCVESGKSYFRKEIVINWSSTVFPYTMFYSYTIGGRPYNGRRSRTWYHGGDSGNLIHVNDSFELPSSTNKVIILLNMTRQVSAVYFCQRFCHFGNIQKLPMIYDQKYKMWKTEFEYTPGLFLPLIYTYEYLDTNSKVVKTGKMRRVSIHGPFGGHHIQICDTLNGTEVQSPIPYYFPPIETCANAIDEVNECVHNSTQTASNYSCIRKRKDMHGVASFIDVICFRVGKKSPSYSKFCLSFDLSSLRYDESCSVGTFSCIKAMADFVLKKGASLLHVAFGRLGNAIVLDPLHANYASKESTENAIRADKERQILETFEHGVKSARYKAFKRVYFEYLKRFVSDERAFYVQYVCYTQLIDVSEYCCRCGVGLVTDISVTDPSTISAAVAMNSLCFNAIKVHDASVITCASLAEFFGSDCWEVIQSTYFTRDERCIKPKPEMRNSKLLVETFKFLDAETRDSLVGKLYEILQYPLIGFETAVSPAFLKEVDAQQSTAVLLLDDQLRKANDEQIFVYTKRPERVPAIRHHVYLSASSDRKTDRKSILADAANRMKLSVTTCEVTIAELAYAFGLTPSSGSLVSVTRLPMILDQMKQFC